MLGVKVARLGLILAVIFLLRPQVHAQVSPTSPQFFDATKAHKDFYLINNVSKAISSLTNRGGAHPALEGDERIYVIESTKDKIEVVVTDNAGIYNTGHYFVDAKTGFKGWASQPAKTFTQRLKESWYAIVGKNKREFGFEDGQKIEWDRGTPPGIDHNLVKPGTPLMRKTGADKDGLWAFAVLGRPSSEDDKIIYLSPEYVKDLSEIGDIDKLAQLKPKSNSNESYKVKLRKVPDGGYVNIAQAHDLKTNIPVRANPGETLYLVQDPDVHCGQEGYVGVRVVKIEQFGTSNVQEERDNVEDRLVETSRYTDGHYCTSTTNLPFADPNVLANTAKLKELAEKGIMHEIAINPVILPSMEGDDGESDIEFHTVKNFPKMPRTIGRRKNSHKDEHPFDENGFPLPGTYAPYNSGAPTLSSEESPIDEEECLKFDSKVFEGEEAGKKIFESIYENPKPKLSAKEKAKKFFEIMAPLARKIQDDTGMPAAIFLAQAAHETGYGSSPVFSDTNNFSGHSCFNYSEQSYKYKINFYYGPNPKEVDVKCMKKRPKREGAYYLSFMSILDSAASYTQNLMFNPKTDWAYGGFRNALKSMKPPIDSMKLSVHLTEYAEDEEYVQKIQSQLRRYKLDQYSNRPLCKEDNDT